MPDTGFTAKLSFVVQLVPVLADSDSRRPPEAPYEMPTLLPIVPSCEGSEPDSRFAFSESS